MSERWRGVLAALANPDLRAVIGELSRGRELTPARRARAVERLTDLGLVRARPDGALVFDDDVVRAILAEEAKPRPKGPERYLDAAGRIDRYPVRERERRELLAWVAARVLSPGEVLGEAELGERLGGFAHDVALLRRHLVDEGLVERTPSGSAYALITRPSD